MSDRRWSDYKPGIFCLLLCGVSIWWRPFQLCQALCDGGSVTFEKVAGVTLRGVNLVPFFKGEEKTAVTDECVTRCRAMPSCQSFLLNYSSATCLMSQVTSDGKRSDIVQFPAMNYFEKICLSTPVCQRLWTFERVLGHELSGFDSRTIPGVSSRLHCEDLCLEERAFPCRSGEFDYVLQQCRLSTEDRRSQPSSFRASIGSVDYFENQCASDGSGSCDYERRENVKVEQWDGRSRATSWEQCRDQCDASHDFLCRAFSFQQTSSLCLQSSDDTFNLGLEALARQLGSEYFQRSNCLDLKLVCSPQGMQLTLSTLQPFTGRIYSQSQPHTCQVYGVKETVTRFVMPIRGKCGIVNQGDGHLINTIVIQHHPLIQQKGDRIIRLFCNLEESNRTITKSLRVETGGEATATAIVNATAPTPNIRLRITNADRDNIQGAKIGENLFFRIEINDSSVFGILARDLVARNGRGDQNITLIDENGCPTNSRIFPAFERIPGTKSLQSQFQAFKFSEDPVVRFEVNVHFCLEECEPVQCPGGVTSWGRRRRRQTATDAPIVPDYPLVTAIIVDGGRVTLLNDSTESPETESLKDGELVCTTKTVIVVSVLGAIFLQLGLLAACATCLLLTRRDRTRYQEDAASTITESLPPFGSGRSMK